MCSSIKVFILGSCVSRDPLETVDNNDFEVVGYYARSSFASLGAEPYVDEKILSKINSNWQRKMVRADMEKSIFEDVCKKEFDILLVDLIDERFNLSVYEDSIHTVSNEYKEALYTPNEYKFIQRNSEEVFERWKIGARKFFSFLRERGLVDKVVLNKVYWTLNGNGDLNEVYSDKYVEDVNFYLDKMYLYINENYPEIKFFDYSDHGLLYEVNHKWGAAPFHYDQYFSKRQINHLKDFFEERNCINNLQENIRVIRYDDEGKKSYFRSDKLALIDEMLEVLLEAESLKKVVAESLESGFLSIPSLVERGCSSVCVSSFIMNYQNYVVFKDVDGSYFLLGQRHLFASDVYFPDENVVLKIDYATFKVEVVDEYFSWRRKCQDLCIEPARFSGVFVSYSRPYHYFYDLLPALYYWCKLFSENLNFPSLNVVEVKEGAFIDLKDFFDFDEHELFDHEKEVNDSLLKKNHFLLKLGYPFDLGSADKQKVMESLDHNLIGYANSALKERKNEDFFGECVIWVGVCNEKRKWVEQEKGIHLLVDYLLETFNTVTVIVDGMTRTVWSDEVAFRSNGHVVKENLNANKIFLKYEECKQLNVISVIGLTSVEKVYYSLKADFFITNFLTDSMYPARFGKVKGVGHGSYKAKHKDHFHPYTAIIKSKQKDDLKVVNKNSNWARQSYSIKPDRVLLEFKKLIDE